MSEYEQLMTRVKQAASKVSAASAAAAAHHEAYMKAEREMRIARRALDTFIDEQIAKEETV